MLKLVTQMTDEELRTEDYDLELDWQHYDYRCDGADEESRKHFESIMDDIDFRRFVISIEQSRRHKAESAHYNRLADEAELQRVMEAA